MPPQFGRHFFIAYYLTKVINRVIYTAEDESKHTGDVMLLEASSKILLPDVDEALDLGYSFHVANDVALSDDNTTRQNAKIACARFLALVNTINIATSEGAYIACTQGIVTSHARGITRRKDRWIKALLEAKNERDRCYQRIHDSRKSSDGLSIVWKLLGPLILGLSGYFFAQVLSWVVPHDVAVKTGHEVPSILLGLVFVFVGRAISFRIDDFNRTQIENEYNVRCDEADKMYELGKLEEYHTYRVRLSNAWKQYTGEEYPITASYQMVMEADLAAREKLGRQRKAFDRTVLWLLKRYLKLVRGKKRTSEVAISS